MARTNSYGCDGWFALLPYGLAMHVVVDYDISATGTVHRYLHEAKEEPERFDLVMLSNYTPILVGT